MAARIRSLRNGIDPIDEASRDDLQIGDVVTVSSLDAATTYNWTIVFAPQDLAGNPSSATFSGVPTDISPGSFTVDHEGAYLIRLVVDAGLPTEDSQYVRLRALTSSLMLALVSAGERRDSSGVIPVDVDIEGWANEQNQNLLVLENAILAGTGALSAVLSVGNISNGNDIELTTGDSLVGQTDLVLLANSGNVEISSTGAASDISLNPGVAGEVVVNGKLTVTGVIDPTAMILSDPASGTDLYYESADGQTAGLAPAGSGRIRYNNSTLQWEQSVDGGGYTAIGSGSTELSVTAGEALAAGNVLAFDSAGDVILADPSLALSPEKFEAKAIAKSAALLGASTNAYPGNGSIFPVLFSAAPPAASNGSRVYLSTTPGVATLSVPPDGNALVKIGVLVGADNLTTTPGVAVDFEVVALLS